GQAVRADRSRQPARGQGPALQPGVRAVPARDLGAAARRGGQGPAAGGGAVSGLEVAERLAPKAVRQPLPVARWLGGLRRIVFRSAAILGLLAIWEAAPRLGLVDSTFL